MYTMKVGLVLAALAVSTEAACAGPCPHITKGTPPSGMDMVPTRDEYNMALKKLDMENVMHDIIHLMTRSKPCWPADRFRGSTIGRSYGGLFIRLAWHCSGSYRNTDKAGGCAGGRMRFNPEASWPDNTNLDKARALLYPIKMKYGDALSWGDLFVMAGTGAILHMGGPVNEVCFGRMDDPNGEKSEKLGPGSKAPPCPVQGECQKPLGASTIGLIYVNPEGFRKNASDLVGTAEHIREVFSRMGMNDSETVALIGGGHAFGKAHGACKTGAGPSPLEQPYNPWPGTCGMGNRKGKGKNTVTSGLEGAWTTDPFKWDNEFFTLLKTYRDTYVVEEGPGGAQQYYTPARRDLMMLTTDLALVYDDKFQMIVDEFATDSKTLDTAFAAAWEKLTTQGAEWVEEAKCFTPDLEKFISPKLKKMMMKN